MKHKHADLIHAWADGAGIEYWDCRHAEWVFVPTPSFHSDVQYRIKPQTKPDVVRLYRREDVQLHMLHGRPPHAPCESDVLRLTFDGNTGRLKAAEVLK